jgi:hypothetical protein
MLSKQQGNRDSAYARSATLASGPLADTPVLAQYTQHLLAWFWEPSTVYHKAGVRPSQKG